MNKLATAQLSETQTIRTAYPDIQPGFVGSTKRKFDYHKTIEQCRFYYENDAIAGTVLNRIVDIGTTKLRNKRKSIFTKDKVSDEIIAYYNVVAAKIQPFMSYLALEYVLHGMVVPDYTIKREMGSRVNDYLGRTRYWFPDQLWCRNPDNIKLTKKPSGVDRFVYLTIPSEDINLVKSKGKNGKIQEYQYLVENFPAYVTAIEADRKTFLLDTVKPLYRKLTSYNDYPIPYLKNALSSMEHKQHLKRMDHSIATRVIEAIRQIKVGDKEYPADDTDITDTKNSFVQNAVFGEKTFNWFTNHTIDMKWIIPPLDALLSEVKYKEPNQEIFFSLGFPRIWVTGETERSNASDNATATIGPLAMINDTRFQILEWIVYLYEQLAEKNGFTRIPEPYLSSINMSDVANLIQYGVDMMNNGAVSKNTLSALYGSDYATEYEQRTLEQDQEKTFIAKPVNDPITNDQVTNNPLPATESI